MDQIIGNNVSFLRPLSLLVTTLILNQSTLLVQVSCKMMKKDYHCSFKGFHKSLSYIYYKNSVYLSVARNTDRYCTGISGISYPLVFYLSCPGLCHCLHSRKTLQSASTSSDNFQAFLNAFTWPCIVNPLGKYQQFAECLNLLIKNGNQLCDLKRSINYMSKGSITGAFLALNCYNHEFNLYVNSMSFVEEYLF